MILFAVFKSFTRIVKCNQLIPLLILVLSVTSCNKEDEPVDNSTSDEYYVRYEVNSSTIYSGGKLDLKLRNEDNQFFNRVIDQRVLHETTIGPVTKGFEASISVNAIGTTQDRIKIQVNIYVSKNGSAFALKKSDESNDPRDNANLTYTIDY